MTALWDEKLDVIDTAEVHWSTSSILAIFFAASLISSVFFGLGYTFGRGGTQKPVFDIGSANTNVIGHDSAVNQSAPRHPVPNAALHTAVTWIAYSHGTASIHSGNESGPPVHAAAVPVKTVRPVPAAHAKAAVLAAATLSYMVQVGAIDNRGDARTLVAQLRKKGFHAGIYSGKHDKFLHVQLGPFTTADQAQMVRHRVMASGYHAILKHAS